MTVNDMIDALTELQNQGHGNDEVRCNNIDEGSFGTSDSVGYSKEDGCVVIEGCN